MILEPPLWATDAWVDESWADGTWATEVADVVHLNLHTTKTQSLTDTRTTRSLMPTRTTEAI